MTAQPRLPKPPFWIAHRGDSANYPENSQRAVEAALALQPAFVEIDVQRSLDGEIVVSHDPDLRRTGARAAVIAETRWDELRTLSVGYADKFGTQFSEQTVPRLEDILAAAQRADGRLMIEVKAAGLGWSVASLLRSTASLRRHIIASFDEQVLVDARAEEPRCLLQLLVDQPSVADVARAVELHACVFGCNQLHVTREVVAAAHEQGLQVWTYTVNDLDRASELAAMGIDGLTTDRVRDFLGQLRSAP